MPVLFGRTEIHKLAQKPSSMRALRSHKFTSQNTFDCTKNNLKRNFGGNILDTYTICSGCTQFQTEHRGGVFKLMLYTNMNIMVVYACVDELSIGLQDMVFCQSQLGSLWGLNRIYSSFNLLVTIFQRGESLVV